MNISFQVVYITVLTITKLLGFAVFVLKLIEYKKKHGKINIRKMLKEWIQKKTPETSERGG